MTQLVPDAEEIMRRARLVVSMEEALGAAEVEIITLRWQLAKAEAARDIALERVRELDAALARAMR